MDEEDDKNVGTSAASAESTDDSDVGGVDVDGALSGSDGAGEEYSIGWHFFINSPSSVLSDTLLQPPYCNPLAAV